MKTKIVYISTDEDRARELKRIRDTELLNRHEKKPAKVIGGTFRLVCHLESDDIPYNASQRKINAAAKKLRQRARQFNPIVPTLIR